MLAPLRIVPPFNASALAATLIPSVSASEAVVTYSKVSVRVPVPLAYSACRVCAPTVSASRGVPVTVTGIWKPTSTEIVSPAP